MLVALLMTRLQGPFLGQRPAATTRITGNDIFRSRKSSPTFL